MQAGVLAVSEILIGEEVPKTFVRAGAEPEQEAAVSQPLFQELLVAGRVIEGEAKLVPHHGEPPLP